MPALAELRGFADYARRLPRFLTEPLSVEDATRRIAGDLAAREERFLTVLGGVFADPRSPYKLLFERAGIELGDVAAMVRAAGIEPALRRRPGELRRAAFVWWTAAAARRASSPIPMPELTPPTDALRVARWLAASGPGVLFSTPSSGVRVCEAAREAGLDLTGAFFSFGGEGYTEAKDRTIRAAGARA